MAEEIDIFLDALAKALLRMGERFWPAHASQMDGYFNDIIALDIYNSIKKLDNKTEKEIANLFPTKGSIISLLYNPLIVGLKVLVRDKKLNQNETINLINNLFKIAKYKTNDNIFCIEKTNKILSEKEIKEITNKEFLGLDEQKKKRMGYLNSILKSLVWATNFDVYAQYGMEVHGTYDISYKFREKSVLIIRDFFDFKKDIWENDLPFNKIRLLNIYKNVNFEFDIGDHFIADNILLQNNTHAIILIDEKEINLNNVEDLIKIVEKILKTQTELVNSFKPEEIIIKAAEINYHTFKKLFDAGRIDIKDSLFKLREFMKKRGLYYWNEFRQKQGKKESMDFIKEIFDPRKKF